MPRLLVVCYGNLCRSPMAEVLLRERLGPRWTVVSAGTSAVEGSPAARLARWAVRELEGLDLDDHASRPLTAQMIEACDQVLTMSRRQAREVVAYVPDAAPRTRLMGGFAPDGEDFDLPADPWGGSTEPDEVADPMGGDQEIYLATCRRLARAADAVAAWLDSDRNEAPAPVSEQPWHASSGR